MYTMEYYVRTYRNLTVSWVTCAAVTSRVIKGAALRHCLFTLSLILWSMFGISKQFQRGRIHYIQMSCYLTQCVESLLIYLHVLYNFAKIDNPFYNYLSLWPTCLLDLFGLLFPDIAAGLSSIGIKIVSWVPLMTDNLWIGLLSCF